MWGLKQIKEKPDENGFKKCELECEFGKNCEQFGSTNTYNKIIKKGNNEKLNKCFTDCGSRKWATIYYIPKNLLKTRRF